VSTASQSKPFSTRERKGPLSSSPELWRELEEGKLLSVVLKDFYARVFLDSRLAHFFEGITQSRVAEQQYSFLRGIIAGERGYFGDRPRNAHHWMVISNELFDYREELLCSCFRRAGLSDRGVEKIRLIDESFRKQIVKEKARAKKLHGVPIPLEGFNDIILEFGTLCDACESPIDVGGRGTYHVRTGRTICTRCAEKTLPNRQVS